MGRLLSYWKRILFSFFLVFVIAVTVYLIGRVTGIFIRAFGVNANLVVDGSASFTVIDIWKNLAQGGESKDRFLPSISSQIRSLSPQYIRIDHIFDYYNVYRKDSSGRLIFDFSKLDEIVADISATGAKPFFSLSYMPPEIGKNGNTTELPNNWSDWEAMVKATVEHYSSQIDNVYYEVWNEPDLFGNFKTYGNKNYLDLYSRTVLAAKKASGVRPFKIGGPATTALYKNWFYSLLKFVQDNNLPLDFYSWHRYSTNLDDYVTDFNNIQKWLTDFPNFLSLELLITESGPNSENNNSNDNVFGAIHALATSSILEGKATRIFNFEIKDGAGPSQFWGRWGIFTNDKFGAPVAKPRFFALNFLNSMSGRRLNTAGDGTWVKAFSKDDNGVIKTLIVNYDPYGKHFEAVPIKFINLKSQNFTYKRLNFLGGVRESNIATTSAAWATTELLNPNSAAMLEIIPK